MYLEADGAVVKKAKAPHELFMINLLLFHLLMTPAAIVLDIGTWGMLLPLSLSLMVMAYSCWRSRRALAEHPLVMLHWRLALSRYRILLIGYGVTAALLLLGFLLTLTMGDDNMSEIMFTVITRIAVVPLILMVFILAFMESSALSMAGNREVPDELHARYFPPVTHQEQGVHHA
jgi:hypothetical protein